jgi:aminopeptidase C
LNKENAIPFYQTNVNHAMLLTGFYYNKSKDKPNYWIIENSHDNKLKKISYENNQGNVIASNSWFKKYCILACVDEQYIHNKDIIEKIKDKKNIIELPKWSNLGELLVT